MEDKSSNSSHTLTKLERLTPNLTSASAREAYRAHRILKLRTSFWKENQGQIYYSPTRQNKCVFNVNVYSHVYNLLVAAPLCLPCDRGSTKLFWSIPKSQEYLLPSLGAPGICKSLLRSAYLTTALLPMERNQ